MNKFWIVINHALIISSIVLAFKGGGESDILMIGLGVILLLGYSFLMVPISKHDWNNLG